MALLAVLCATNFIVQEIKHFSRVFCVENLRDGMLVVLSQNHSLRQEMLPCFTIIARSPTTSWKQEHVPIVHLATSKHSPRADPLTYREPPHASLLPFGAGHPSTAPNSTHSSCKLFFLSTHSCAGAVQ